MAMIKQTCSAIVLVHEEVVDDDEGDVNDGDDDVNDGSAVIDERPKSPIERRKRKLK